MDQIVVLEKSDFLRLQMYHLAGAVGFLVVAVVCLTASSLIGAALIGYAIFLAFLQYKYMTVPAYPVAQVLNDEQTKNTEGDDGTC